MVYSRTWFLALDLRCTGPVQPYQNGRLGSMDDLDALSVGDMSVDDLCCR